MKHNQLGDGFGSFASLLVPGPSRLWDPRLQCSKPPGPRVAAVLPGPAVPLGLREEETPRPAHTPDQAEGEDPASERERPEDDALRRRRPSQAEGEDRKDEADHVPPDHD
jgi:hypothetical protein